MGGDQRAPDAGGQPGHEFLIELGQLGRVRRRPPIEPSGIVGREPPEHGGDPADDVLHAAGIEPDVGIVLRGIEQAQRLARPPLGRPFHRGLEAAAHHEHQLRVLDAVDVGGLQLEVVRLHAWRGEVGYAHRVAAHRPDRLGNGMEGRDDIESPRVAVPGRLATRAEGGGHHRKNKNDPHYLEASTTASRQAGPQPRGVVSRYAVGHQHTFDHVIDHRGSLAVAADRDQRATRRQPTDRPGGVGQPGRTGKRGGVQA